jgi:hypothetical protein
MRLFGASLLYGAANDGVQQLCPSRGCVGDCGAEVCSFLAGLDEGLKCSEPSVLKSTFEAVFMPGAYWHILNEILFFKVFVEHRRDQYRSAVLFVAPGRFPYVPIPSRLDGQALAWNHGGSTRVLCCLVPYRNKLTNFTSFILSVTRGKCKGPRHRLVEMPYEDTCFKAQYHRGMDPKTTFYESHEPDFRVKVGAVKY